MTHLAVFLSSARKGKKQYDERKFECPSGTTISLVVLVKFKRGWHTGELFLRIGKWVLHQRKQMMKFYQRSLFCSLQQHRFDQVGADRMACAWFIKRYLDADAQFAFIPYGQLLAEKEHAFDTPDAAYSHKRGRCSFDMMVKALTPRDKALLVLAEIVNGADEASDTLPPPERYGVEALCTGTRLKASSDAEALIEGLALYDALLCFIQSRSRNRGERQ